MTIDCKKNEILYPPTIIGHVVDDVADLFEEKIQKCNQIKIYYGYQLNGSPHLGTASSLGSCFALGDYLSKKFRKPVSIIINSLENGPGEKREVNGIVYQKMLCHTTEGELSVAEKYRAALGELLDDFSKISGIDFQFESYQFLQSKPYARKILLDLLERENEFSRILDPSSKRLRVRFPCPICMYADKHARTLEVEEHIPGEKMVLKSTCFKHGDHRAVISKASSDFIDVNTMVRNVLKEATIIDESEHDSVFPLIGKGADWAHASTLISNALELLGYSFERRPDRISVPMIEDWSGAKISKSLYIPTNAYDYLPSELTSFQNFKKRYGALGMKRFWDELKSWVHDPKKLYRNYSIDYLQHVFEGQITPRHGGERNLPSYLLTIRKNPAQALLNGTKPHEFRRKFANSNERIRAFLYVTDPVKSILGEVVFDPPARKSTSELRELLRDNKHDTLEGVERYINGADSVYALPVVSTIKYDRPIGLDELRQQFSKFTPPMSYVRLDSPKYEKIREFLDEKGE